jgi:arginine repressor
MAQALGRPSIDLEPWRNTITNWIQRDKLTQREILEELRANGTSCSRPTLARSLSSWRVIKNIRAPTAGPERETLHERARFAFTNLGESDKRVSEMLQREGYTIGQRAVASMRREMGIYKRIPLDQQEDALREIVEILKQEIRDGRIGRYGRRHLAAHMRRHYNTPGRDRIYQALKIADPEGCHERRRSHKARRGKTLIPGPDHIWSLDGHCKLEHYGIQIYGAIDAYSR